MRQMEERLMTKIEGIRKDIRKEMGDMRVEMMGDMRVEMEEMRVEMEERLATKIGEVVDERLNKKIEDIRK